jgi:hypothetical protein
MLATGEYQRSPTSSPTKSWSVAASSFAAVEKKFYLASSASYPSGLFLSQDVMSVMHIIPSGKKPISILHNVSGIIKPGK